MASEPAGMFEEFDESGRRPDSSDLLRALVVRPARPEDADEIGRISAAREGGDVEEHRVAVRRLLEDSRGDRSRLVLVATLGDRVIGFGKARYLRSEGRTSVGETPDGWYLTGVIVDSEHRRRGVGARLTAERLSWIADRDDAAYYFANARNRVTVALHEGFGFVEVARGAEFGGVSFTGGEGVLFKADVKPGQWRAP